MDTALDDWQLYLEAHFKSLAERRNKIGAPVFAIEHGLATNSLRQVIAALRKDLSRGNLSNKHWLLWVVYATELGYDYDGQEYWPSFEQRTPGWNRDPHRRNHLQQWFVKFHNTYNGVRPTGPWAAQFSIISWPITHAFLPRDLQIQLARVLYEQRYVLAQFVDAPIDQVGHIIALSAHHASSRFRNFLQQEELVGRMVLTLLGATHGSTSYISVQALDRIIADLETQRVARVWLYEARTAIESTKVRLASRKPRSSADVDTDEPSSADAPIRGRTIRPRLTLIRGPKESWDAVIEIPSFGSLDDLGPHYATFLRKNRCRVSGAGTNWNPPGWLLYGPQRRKLLAWPNPNNPVVEFEQEDTAIATLLQADCRISPGPIWVFKINGDGTATEVSKRYLNRNTEYVIVHLHALDGHSLLRRTNISSHGVMASMLHVPESGKEDALRELRDAGLFVERTLRVWPVGLPAPHWDSDGQAEWFDDEIACIAVDYDRQVDAFNVRLDFLDEANISVELHRPTLFSVGKLPPGLHKLVVTPVHKETGTKAHVIRAPIHAEISLLIRKRHPWVPGTTNHLGLVVSTEPNHPTLDNLLDGHVSVLISGPDGRNVRCYLEFMDAAGRVLHTEQIAIFQMPISPYQWTSAIEKLRVRETAIDSYTRASAASLVVDGGEVGCYRLQLEYLVAPLRWIITDKRQVDLFLIDDSAQEETVSVQFASFKKPTFPIKLKLTDKSKPVRPSEHGGLYIASSGRNRACIVVSVFEKANRLHDIADQPEVSSNVSSPENITESILESLTWLQYWAAARVVGPLAAQRRSLVVQAIERQIVLHMCGKRWHRLEQAFQDTTDDCTQAKRDLEEYFNADKLLTFAIKLSQQHEAALSDSIHESARFLCDLIQKFRRHANQSLCEAALRFSLTPHYFIEWSGESAITRVIELREYPWLVRATRLIALLSGERRSQISEKWRP